MQSDPLEQKEREEQPSLVTGQDSPRAAAALSDVGGKGKGQRAAADVGISANHVGVRVMGVVFGNPPSEAQAREQVAGHQPDQLVGPTGFEYLVVAGIMGDEVHLCEQEGEKGCNAQRHPGVPDREKGHPAAGKSSGDKHHLGDIDGRLAVQ